MTTKWRRYVRRGRWALAAIIAITATALLANVGLTSGNDHRAARYLVMAVWSFAQVIIPALLAIDLLAHGIAAIVLATRGEIREAGALMGWTVLCDFALLALAVGAGFAMVTMG